MSVTIRTPQGKVISLTVSDDETVQGMVDIATEKAGQEGETMGLLFEGSADVDDEYRREWNRGILSRRHIRECLSECLGTFILVAFGTGSIAQTVLSSGDSGSSLSINFAFGFGFMIALFTSGVSGGHINPAVSFTLAVFGRFEWKRLFGYCISQLIGAYLGGLLVYCVYYQGIHAEGGFTMETADIFITSPAEFESQFGAFVSEAFTTAFLLIGIFHQSDPQNYPSAVSFKPVVLGFLLVAIGMSFGLGTGASLNPARDFGPRLMLWMVGWGNKVFTDADYYFWIPLVAPFVGGVVGATIYEVMIERRHARKNKH